MRTHAEISWGVPRKLVRGVHGQNSIGRAQLSSDPRVDPVSKALTDKRGAIKNPKKKSSENKPAVHLATRLGHGDVVSKLLENGANVDAKSGRKSDSESAVELACWSGHFDILEELLDRAAKLGFSEVSVFLRTGPAEKDLLSRVLDLANLDLEGKEGTELLAGAGSMNQLFADALISRGAQPDILTACRLGRADHVERLIEQKPALLNAAETGYPHSTPISVAVSNGQAAIVQLLINQGCDIAGAE